MAVHPTAVDEVGEHRLLERGHVVAPEPRVHDVVDELGREDQPAQADAGRQRLGAVRRSRSCCSWCHPITRVSWEARRIDVIPDLTAPRVAVPTAVRRELRTVAIAASVGVLAGVVVLGIGSRLAMRAIAATSNPALKGVLTSDREPIGEITLDGTISLLLFVGVIGGVLLGVGYVALRWLLPSDLRARAVCMALVTWCLGGAVVFDAEDFDFRFLEPAWLSVLMFSAVFLAAGWVIAAGIEVAARRWPTERRGWWRFAPLVLLLPFFPLFAAAVVVALLRSSDVVRRIAALPPVVPGGRVLLVVGVLALGIPAMGEVVEIL